MRVAIVGLGSMGRNHLRVARDLGLDPLTVDVDPSRADYCDLSLVEVDAAVIATPPWALAAEARKAISQGAHVLVEKPGGVTPAQLASLGNLARVHDVYLTVGYTERHNPAVHALRSFLHTVGTVHHIHAHRVGLPPGREWVSPSLDLAVHDLDVLRYLGFDPALQHSSTRPGHVVATLSMGDGATATLEASHLHRYKGRSLEVVGEYGSVSVDYQTREVSVNTRKLEGTFTYKGEPLRDEWIDFLSSVDARRKPNVNDALRVLSLASCL